MTNLKWIYYLVDPITQKVRYVGSSVDPTKRFQNHLSEKRSSKKQSWIKRLEKKGLTPELRFVVQGNDVEIRKLEAKHIRKFNPKDLFNKRTEDRDCRIEFRLKEDEFEYIKDLANKFADGNVSRFIRWAVNYSCEHGEKDLIRFIDENLESGKKIKKGPLIRRPLSSLI